VPHSLIVCHHRQWTYNPTSVCLNCLYISDLDAMLNGNLYGHGGSCEWCATLGFNCMSFTYMSSSALNNVLGL
jgi:hypothetical protein